MPRAAKGQGTVDARHASRIWLGRQSVLCTVSPDRGGGFEREPDPELVNVRGREAEWSSSSSIDRKVYTSLVARRKMITTTCVTMYDRGWKRLRKQETGADSVSQLVDDVHQLICGDELYPAVELLLLIVEHELDAVVAPEVCRTALVLLFDNLALSFNPDAGLVQSKLPSVERSAIPRGCVLWNVEFES